MLGRRSISCGLLFALMLLVSGGIALADKLTLKDGTVLEGTIIKQTDHYWVKTADGESRMVAVADVASFSKAAGREVSFR